MIITNKILKKFEELLISEEKSENTISKYVRDVGVLQKFANEHDLTKQLMIEYKAWLAERYKPTSANSMIAAANKFLKFIGCGECIIRQFKIQRSAYVSECRELTYEEYERLVRTAYKKRNTTIAIIMETIAATGIRVSELKFITVESLSPAEFIVSLKGKTRKVMLVKSLCLKLRRYCKEHGITHGTIFRQNRTSIWKQMKTICRRANVEATKVFPHNLRHLFARCFYEIEKDVVKLADVLGHSNINTTHTYLISSGREHRRLLENMRMVLSG